MIVVTKNGYGIIIKLYNLKLFILFCCASFNILNAAYK